MLTPLYFCLLGVAGASALVSILLQIYAEGLSHELAMCWFTQVLVFTPGLVYLGAETNKDPNPFKPEERVQLAVSTVVYIIVGVLAYWVLAGSLNAVNEAGIRVVSVALGVGLFTMGLLLVDVRSLRLMYLWWALVTAFQWSILILVYIRS